MHHRPAGGHRVDILLGPDVFVNASVALGSPPEQVIKRVLGKPGAKHKTTEWVLGRVEAMLGAVPSFKKEAVGQQMSLIRNLVDVVKIDKDPGEPWDKGLVASAKAAGYKRVITDHPDLADKTEVDGILFVSSDAWLVEQTTPPPPPPPGAKKK